MVAILQKTFWNAFFFKENIWISFKISLRFVPRDLTDNITTLVQIMAWRQPSDKPLSEPMVVSLLRHIGVTRPQWVKLTPHMRFCQSLFTNTVYLRLGDRQLITSHCFLWNVIYHQCPNSNGDFGSKWMSIYIPNFGVDVNTPPCLNSILVWQHSNTSNSLNGDLFQHRNTC